MFKLVATVSSLLLTFSLFAPSAAQAATVIIFGNTNGALASATLEVSLVAGGFTGTLTNTSPGAPQSADIVGWGFDLVAGDFAHNNSTGGLNGFTGTVVPDFTFSDGDFGNVPQFNAAVIDFGYGDLNGGTPNLFGPGDSRTFTVTGDGLAGFTDEQIAAAVFVRWQDVGPNGNLSDVGTPGPPTVVPEPASMMLFGTGLMYLARRKMRKSSV